MKQFKLILLGLILIHTPHIMGQPTVPADSTHTLNEVVVKGYTPQVKTKGTVTTVKIKGTVLSQMGNASTMLENTPGLHRGTSGIEVNGLGKPIFILNDREIDPNKVLDLLQANTIKEIKINKAPDLSYFADGRPTVEIILNRPVDDFILLSVGNDMAVRRKFSDAGTANFGINVKKISTTIDYLGGISQFLNKETYFRNIFHPLYVSSFDQKREDMHKDLPQRVRWALDYNIDKEHRLGLEYYYQFNKKSAHETGSDFYDSNEKNEEFFFNRQKEGIANLHNISLQYHYKKGKRTFQIVQDFGASSSRNNVETTDGTVSTDKYSHARNRYDISTTNIKFGTRLPYNINFMAGVKNTFISNNSSSSLEYSGRDRSGYRLSTDIKEYEPQVFLSLSRKIGNVTVNAGGRYRYMRRKVKNGEDNTSMTTKTYDVSSFSPLVSLTYRSSAGTSFYLRYNRTIDHPNFGSLNSGYVYMDSLTYTTGNPDLKTSFSNIISAGVSWRDFTFSARYSHVSNPIVRVSELMEEGSDIIVERDINLRYDNQLRLGLEYSKTISGLNMYAEASVVFPHGKYLFAGKEYTADRISVNGNLNLNYRINSFLGAYLSFNYQGYNQNLTLTQKAANNLSAGIVATLLRNRLTLNLAFTDILNGTHYNNITYRYGNVANGTYGTNDERGVMFRLSYSIFTKKIRTRTNRNNNEEIQRLY